MAACGGLAGSPAVDNSVVFYTSWPQSTTQKVVDAFNQAHPDIQASFVLGETLELAARIEAERSSGSLGGDVVVLADAAVTKSLADSGAFVTTDVAAQHEILDGFVDPEGRWAAPRVAVGSLWYNVEILEEAGLAPPDSWFDLLEPEYAKLTVMPSPLVAGTMATLLSGTVPDPRFGWDYWETLAARGASFTNYVTDAARMVAAGQAGIGYTLSNYIQQYPLHPQGSTRIVAPEEGVVVVPSAAAVLEGAPHPGSAQVFFRYLMSPEVAEVLVADQNYSTHVGATSPDGLTPLDELNQMKLDTAWLMEPDTRSEIQARWQAVTRGGVG
jgi:iron(III) transport system substrate-binding protein